LQNGMITALPEVYTAREIAEAAGAAESQVSAMMRERYVPHDDAVRIVRAILHGDFAMPAGREAGPRLLAPALGQPRAGTMPFLVSTSVHGAVAAALIVLTSLGLTRADERMDIIEPDAQPIRMVYLALPGPGGGGGGGGLRMPTPPPKVERKGPPKSTSSPLPARRLPPPVTPPPPKPEPPPPPLEAKTLPPVVAPVATVAADTRNQEGLLKEMPKDTPPSQGSGIGGGAGSGQGTGIGEGTGSGIGPGEGGGMGGGPYRPGSGVTPPRLLKEVRADYTEEARRANLTGEVVLEIVVRRDGSVGDVRVLQRLGSGLDQRAVTAVRQWRFAPATLKGVPVDVIVEVGVEFKLR
jgi:protein TonB